ncbi:MAG: DegT/DnrJ/EryC1/StrS family aminotransferase [Ilumatobacteraceae bacterium]|nr:DegT/DnrJ/EryC1/StrS family aminotransferase [Acidimicrobiaceae bacterium]MBP6489286.1 DegT/DnrJ/EryC1/StrS family aminotransferase [Ilumatobacteraceae bacterium]MBP7890583.1 DegT/DnrJ/EryC1/StrS family aminotransferase [Ilumatobacteraceae bacterium]MBP8211165.1 DegT/DnrJ/EryC1/StrS family aminotransferase [Ilumatobacteraceae bacterium]
MSTSRRAGFVNGLAAFGGTSHPQHPLYVGRPNIPNRDAVLARVGTALDNRWLSNDGPMVREFEEVVEARLGVRHCVAVANATLGLGIVARALGLHGEVVVPAFTFVATAHSLAWQGITPVFCDIDRDSHQLDPAAVEAVITERTTGILAAHTWGRPCDIDGLSELAARHHLELFFDAAPAYGASYRGTYLGHFGRAEVLSFHATKIVNSGEGGAILTNDDEIAASARLMRTFGFADTDLVTSIGTNAKMSELAAGMGICSLASYDEYLAVNTRNFSRYCAALADVPGITVVPCAPDTAINFNNVVIEIDPRRAGIERDIMLQVLTAEQILARRYFWPGCHRMEPYRSLRTPADHHFPITDLVAGRVLSLPTGTSIEPADIDRVCELISGIVEHGEEISARAGNGIVAASGNQ